MHRRTLTCLALLTLFLFSSVNLFITNPNTPLLGANTTQEPGGTNIHSTLSPKEPLPPEGPTWDGTHYLYEGLGQTLSTQEYALGNKSLSISDLDYGSSKSGNIRLPRGWTGYQLTADVYDLFDNISQIDATWRNGDCEDGSGTDPDYWSYDDSSPPFTNNTGSNSYGYFWSSTAGYGSGNGLAVWVDYDSFYWDADEYIAWEQDVNLEREVEWARLTFRVQTVHISGFTGDEDEIAIYVEIEGIRYIFVCIYYAPADGGWRTLNLSIPIDDIQTWNSSSINIKLGAGTNFPYNYDSAALYHWYFDDVQLITKGKPKPDHSAIQLRLNSTTTWTATDYGQGTVTITDTWGPFSTDQYIKVEWRTGNSSITDASVEFKYILNLSVKKSSTTGQQTPPHGSSFRVQNGGPVYWTVWYYAFQPSGYHEYDLAITRISTETWTLAEVRDPLFTDQTSAVNSASNSSHIKLDYTFMSEYGWWNFTFTSTNRISSVSGLQANYDIGETLSITVTHSVSVGETNLTIYDSDRNVVHEEQRTVDSTQEIFTEPFSSGFDYLAGQYTLCLSYDNGATPTQTRAGFYSNTFNIIHATDLTPEASVIEVTRGPTGFFYPRVNYSDLNRGGAFIDNSSGTVTVTGTVSGQPIAFYQAGSVYEAKIANDLLALGDHTLNINADDPYYDADSTSIILEVRSPAQLYAEEAPGLTTPYDETFTIHVFYNDSFGAGITLASVTTDWPTNPTGSGNGTPGWYEITFDTADQQRTDTYTLKITAYRQWYQSKTVTLTIVVRKISTTIDYTPPGSVPWDEDVDIDFTLSVNDPESTVHDGEGITTATFTFQLGGSPLTGGEYSLTPHGSGQYTLTILASSGKINAIQPYTLIIQATQTETKYSNTARTLTFSVRSLSTIITYIPPAPQPWGNDLVITLNFTVDDPESTIHDGENILGLLTGDISCLLSGSPLTSFGWVPWGDRYNITVYSSSIHTAGFYTLRVTVTHSNTIYNPATRMIAFQVLSHQTQTIVTQPDPVPYGDPTNGITVQWSDINGTSLNPYPSLFNYLQVRFASNNSLIATRFTLVFNLDTSSWLPGTYNLIVTTFPATTQYLGSTGNLRIIIIRHQTAVNVIPPEATPAGYTTDVTIQWFDLTVGGQISYTEVDHIDISGAITDTISGPLTSWTITLDTSSLGIGTYSITVTVYAKTSPTQIYEHASGDLLNALVIRAHRVYVLVTGPPPVPEDGQILISIDWTDLDTGLPISTGVLDYVEVTKISGPTAVGLPHIDSNLEFYIDATGWDTGTFRLNVTVYSTDPNYATGWGSVNIVIRVHSITADVDPIPRVPYGNNVTITLRVNDSDLIPSAGLPEGNIVKVEVIRGLLTLTFDSTPGSWDYWVVNGSTIGQVGVYFITLDTTTWNIQTWPLTIKVYTSTNYGDGVVFTSLIVRKITTAFIYQVPPTVPWDEDANLTVRYFVADPDADQDDNPIAGASISIYSHTYGTLTRYTHFDYINHGDGNYTIIIFSNRLGAPDTSHRFDISIHLNNQYADGHLTGVEVTVRKLLTWLHPYDVPQTPFGDNVVLEVIYEVQDGDSSHDGERIAGATIRINVSTLVHGVDYLVQWIAGSQIYRITIYYGLGNVDKIQLYTITVETIDPHPVGYTKESIPSLEFQVRTVAATIQVVTPDHQAWGNVFSIQVIYKINDPDTPTRNGNPISGYANNITLIGYTWGVDYTVTDFGTYYMIYINSSKIFPINEPGTYSLTVEVAWTESPPPYTYLTKATTATITERPTHTSNTPGGEFGYAGFIKVNFTLMDDERSDTWITNGTYGNHLLLAVYWKHPVYTSGTFQLLSSSEWSTTLLVAKPDAYMLRISAAFSGYVNEFFDFRIDISWDTNYAPYFASSSFTFRAYVIGQRTVFVLQPTVGATPYGQLMNFTFRYQTDQGVGINNTSPEDYVVVSISCPEVPGFGTLGVDWWLINLGNGYYEVRIDTTLLAGIGTYLFYVSVDYEDDPNPTPAPFYEPQLNQPVIQTVRLIDTLLHHDDLDNLYYGENLTIYVQYSDRDNGGVVPLSVFLDVAGFTGPDPEITYITNPVDPHYQWFEIIVSTAGSVAGSEYTFYIFANKTYYLSQNISLYVYIYEVPLQVTLITSPVFSRYYGETPWQTITVEVEIAAGLQYGTPVLDAIVSIIHPALAFTNNGDGTYSLTVNSTWNIGTYILVITATKPGAYEDDSTSATYTVSTGPAYISPYNCETTFILYPPDNYTIAIYYESESGPIVGATVYYASPDPLISNGTLHAHPTIPGVYYITFNDTDQYSPVPYAIAISANFPNVQRRTLSFTADVRYTPAVVLSFENLHDFVNASNYIIVEYQGSFTVWIFAANTRNISIPLYNRNMTGIDIEATWGAFKDNLTEVGDGWYTYTFQALQDAGFQYALYLDLLGNFDVLRTTITVEVIDRPTEPIVIDSAWSILGGLNRSAYIGATLTVPIGDNLTIYLRYLDVDLLVVANGTGTVTIDGVGVPGVISFDPVRGLYILNVYIDPDTIGTGTHSMSIRLGKTNFDPQLLPATFTVINIPMEMSITDYLGIVGLDQVTGRITVYIGSPFSIRILLEDTWHGIGVEGATITLPVGWLIDPAYPDGWIDEGGGYYTLYGLQSGTEGSIGLTITAKKTAPLMHQPTTLQGYTLVFEFNPVFELGIFAGISATIIIIIILLGWIMWVRVYSIPWEVRRMRRLAKSVEKDEGFELSKKDLKRFHARELTLKDKVTAAMSTVGVAATPAMLPAIETVEEVTATEEDIMAELDKIPGLGPEEKAVLAEEMRKIPRKDRIWFLDDLRKQMGQRRMDFLTKRELGEVTALPEEAPVVKAPPVEAAPEVPLEEVKAKEPPPPDRVLTEDRTAPTVLRPEFEPVRVDPAVIAEIKRELAKVSGLSKGEKEALMDHLKHLSKEERQATYISLRQSADMED